MSTQDIWTMDDVEVHVAVSDEADASATEVEEQGIQATEEGALEVEKATEEAQMFIKLYNEVQVMKAHLEHQGWDVEFSKLYNKDGRITKTLGLRVPSMESLASMDCKDSALTIAAIHGMEGLGSKIVDKIKSAFKKIAAGLKTLIEGILLRLRSNLYNANRILKAAAKNKEADPGDKTAKVLLPNVFTDAIKKIPTLKDFETIAKLMSDTVKDPGNIKLIEKSRKVIAELEKKSEYELPKATKIRLADVKFTDAVKLAETAKAMAQKVEDALKVYRQIENALTSVSWTTVFDTNGGMRMEPRTSYSLVLDAINDHRKCLKKMAKITNAVIFQMLRTASARIIRA